MAFGAVSDLTTGELPPVLDLLHLLCFCCGSLLFATLLAIFLRLKQSGCCLANLDSTLINSCCNNVPCLFIAFTMANRLSLHTGV